MTTNSKNLMLLQSLISASTEEEVTKIIEGNPVLLNPNNWQCIGARVKGEHINNHGLVHGQQSDPIGALTEKITNSIDSVLIQACKRKEINPESTKAPSNIYQAVENFFGIPNGDLINLHAARRWELSDKVKVYIENSKKKKSELGRNVWVIDSGEGQIPENIPNTFLSIMRENKNKIRFVHGRYNMGGLSSLGFCGEKKYQLLITRKDPALTDGVKNNKIGFTLVREYYPTDKYVSNPEYQYCTLPDGSIFTVDYNPNEKLEVGYGELDEFEYGAVIKLYNYQISCDLYGLLIEVKKNLFKPAIPFQVRGIKGTENKKRIIDGNVTRLIRKMENPNEKDEENDEEKNSAKIRDWYFAEAELGDLGKRKIEITVFNNTNTKYFVEKSKVVFFTINGQTHGTLPQYFITSKDKLSALEDRLLIHVDCTDVPNRVRNEIFMSDRETIKKSKLEAIKSDLTKFLLSDERLLHIAKSIVPEYLNKGTKITSFKKLASRVVKFAPEVRESLQGGEDIRSGRSRKSNLNKKWKQRECMVVKENYTGNFFPTKFEYKGWNKSKGQLNKDLPIDGYINLEFETDVNNDFFSRKDSPGKFVFISDGGMLVKKTGERLFNGRLTLQLRAGEMAEIDKAVNSKFQLVWEGSEALSVDYLQINLTKAKPQIEGNGNTKNNSSNNINKPDEGLPELIQIDGKDWEFGETRKISFGDNVIYLNMSSFDNPAFVGEFSNNPRELAIAKDNYASLMYYKALTLWGCRNSSKSKIVNEEFISALQNPEILNAILVDYEKTLFITLPLNKEKLLRSVA